MLCSVALIVTFSSIIFSIEDFRASITLWSLVGVFGRLLLACGLGCWLSVCVECVVESRSSVNSSSSKLLDVFNCDKRSSIVSCKAPEPPAFRASSTRDLLRGKASRHH